MDKTILNALSWLFIFGGLYAFVNGFIFLLNNKTPEEYGVLGIGGGFWLLSAAIVIYIKNKI